MYHTARLMTIQTFFLFDQSALPERAMGLGSCSSSGIPCRRTSNLFPDQTDCVRQATRLPSFQLLLDLMSEQRVATLNSAQLAQARAPPCTLTLCSLVMCTLPSVSPRSTFSNPCTSSAGPLTVALFVTCPVPGASAGRDAAAAGPARRAKHESSGPCLPPQVFEALLLAPMRTEQLRTSRA